MGGEIGGGSEIAYVAGTAEATNVTTDLACISIWVDTDVAAIAGAGAAAGCGKPFVLVNEMACDRRQISHVFHSNYVGFNGVGQYEYTLGVGFGIGLVGTALCGALEIFGSI